MISTASDTVTAHRRLPTAPKEIAFSPSTATAYVSTSAGLWVLNAANLRVVTVTRVLSTVAASVRWGGNQRTVWSRASLLIRE